MRQSFCIVLAVVQVSCRLVGFVMLPSRNYVSTPLVAEALDRNRAVSLKRWKWTLRASVPARRGNSNLRARAKSRENPEGGGASILRRGWVGVRVEHCYNLGAPPGGGGGNNLNLTFKGSGSTQP